MNIFRKRRSHNQIEALSLSWPNSDGTAGESFPGEVIEGLRHMVTRMRRQRIFPARLAVAAALRGEGVSTIARALAVTLAHDLGARVCLVDLNWNWPSPAVMTESENGGLAAVLSGEATLDDVLAPTGWSNLAYLPAGTIPAATRPVLARSERLHDTIDQLNWRYEHLVLDVPALLATNDAVPLVSLATSVCLVIHQGATTVNDVRKALGEIEHLSVAGTILNRTTFKTPQHLMKFVPAW